MEKIFMEEYPVNQIDPSKLIILAGAGISCQEPTCLPLGKELTEAYLDLCLDKATRKWLMHRWAEISEAAYSMTGAECPFMRLESVIGLVDDVDKEFGYTRMLNGFMAFDETIPNSCHYSIRFLMEQGAEVITPNFDRGIERAFAKPITMDMSLSGEMGFPVESVAGHQVYHYHGIGSQPENLGTTLASIKKGFSSAFQNLLQGWLEQGYSLLCVGFSCSDYFDCVPFFESLPHNRYSGNAIFFQHYLFENNAESVVAPSLEERLEKFFYAFSERKILYGKTDEFLNKLVKSRKQVENDIDQGTVKGSEENSIGIMGKTPGWRQTFDKLSNDNMRYKPYYFVRLANQFSFFVHDEDVPSIREDKDCILLKEFDYKELLKATGQRFVKDTGCAASNDVKISENVSKYLKEGRFHIFSKSVCFDLIQETVDMGYVPAEFAALEKGFQDSKSNVVGISLEITIERLLKEIDDCERSGRIFNREFVFAHNRICKKYICLFLKQGRKEINKDIVVRLHKGTRKLTLFPYSQFEYISFKISVMKVYNILEVLLSGKDPCFSVKDLASMALEICYLDDVIKCFRNRAIQDMLLYVINIRSRSERMKYSIDFVVQTKFMAQYMKVLNTDGLIPGHERWLRISKVMFSLIKILIPGLRWRYRLLSRLFEA